MNDYLAFAQRLALRAGDIMLKYFDTNVERQVKDDKTLVTTADHEINEIFINEVEKRYPNHSIIGEEASKPKDSEFVWVCDPLDGTTQYSKSIPVAVSSFALVHQGTPIVGAVYDPFTRRLYTASKGNGAFLNGKPIAVSNKKLNYDTIIDDSWWPTAEYDTTSALHRLSLETKTDIMRIGSTINAACQVAVGHYEAVVFAGSTNHDIASAKVIVEEAGGRVTDLFGQEQPYDRDIRGAVISNGVVHADILAAMKF